MSSDQPVPPPPGRLKVIVIRFLAVLCLLTSLPFIGLALFIGWDSFEGRFDAAELAVAVVLLLLGVGFLAAAIRSFRRPKTIFPVAAPLVILAVLLAIAIPNMIPRGSKQKRTMADMRSIATAWEARATDYNRYNAAGYSQPTYPVSQHDLESLVTPTYIRTFPANDGWGHPWIFAIDQPLGSEEAAQVYTIISFGKDGKQQRDTPEGPTTNFDCDIVFSNGSFTVYPEGAQTN